MSAWCTTRISPPGATAASNARGASCVGVRRSAGYCAETRSNPPGEREASRRPAWIQRTWTPACRACRAARSKATSDTSSAVTSQPRSASHTASAPSPQPTSRARPGGRPATCVTSAPLGLPLQTLSASAYRASHAATLPASARAPWSFSGPPCCGRDAVTSPIWRTTASSSKPGLPHRCQAAGHELCCADGRRPQGRARDRPVAAAHGGAPDPPAREVPRRQDRLRLGVPDEAIIGFGYPREERGELLAAEPEKFLPPLPGDERCQWLRVRLAAIDETELRELLVDAWRMVVPQRLARAHGEA